jgi:hypothetical protein
MVLPRQEEQEDRGKDKDAARRADTDHRSGDSIG